MRPKREVEPDLRLTESAIAMTRLLRQRLGRPDSALRIAIVGDRGPEGYEYFVGFDDSPEKDDLRLPFQDFDLVVDPETYQLIRGAKVNYVDSPEGSGYVVEAGTPPDRQRRCSEVLPCHRHCKGGKCGRRPESSEKSGSEK